VSRSVLAALAESSIALIAEHQHASGAYPACPDYPVYRYSWFRDGAFIADAMSRAGQPDSAAAFFDWCAGVIGSRTGRIAELVDRAGRGEPVSDAELLPTRYTLDGSDDHDPWWNFQLDGYGTWLWALGEHLARHDAAAAGYRDAVASTVDYLVTFGRRPCFDWWEENADQVHTSTLAAVAAGLRAALALVGDDGGPLLDPDRAGPAHAAAATIDDLIRGRGVHDGHLTKWLGGTDVDGSLLACISSFGTVSPGSPVAERTYAEVRRRLMAHGVYRYRGDTFYGGGEWLILTAWLGWYERLTGRDDDALTRLEWIADQATPDGQLPEQVSAAAQDPSFIPMWTKRWGPVATPLLWSHAMFVTLAIETKVWSPS
jgi:GH15 family glucan-1,4-alpha-glucosidase